MGNFLALAQEKIQSVSGRPQSRFQRSQLAVTLAKLIMQQAQDEERPTEKKLRLDLARLVNDPEGRAFAVSFLDQSFRSKDPVRIVEQWRALIKESGIPSFLTGWERFGLRLFKYLGHLCPHLWVPLVKQEIHRKASSVIVEAKFLEKHLDARRQEGMRLNLNRLGEAILGEEEADRRLALYLSDARRENIAALSVKISTLYSQVSPLAKEETLSTLKERLRQLYRTGKWINLDMEEYRDLTLTVELFQELLNEPEFHATTAGIVLQSYLPDSFEVQQKLTQWAMQRLAAGGAAIKLRLVKGANLAMEQVEASLKGWPQAPYSTKTEVDAQYKRMLEFGCRKEHAEAVHIGVGSHNLFDIAYALLLRSEQQVEPYVTFEMLEGMANPVARVVQKLTGDLLLYCPVAEAEDFQYALAYLIRRLDENTAPDNFLRDSFALKPEGEAWERQKSLFLNSCAAIDHTSTLPRRIQNRWLEIGETSALTFVNEPDTDWSLPQNVSWAEAITTEWREKPILKGVAENSIESLEKIIAQAKFAQIKWEATPSIQRSKILAQVAKEFRFARKDLMGIMAAETSKSLMEADSEISEAIDFIEYYRQSLKECEVLTDIEWRAKGILAVASPWNFPCSIPVSGIAAALLAGNSVIFKPAPEAVGVGRKVAELFWKGGIDPEILHFLYCDEEKIGTALITHPDIAAVILTGATATAKLFLRLRPHLDLMAETGGKNSLIISRLADRDLAIRDLLHSAFGYSGQKCSACSLAICEAEVYEDPLFLQTLKDAAASLALGSPWNLKSRITPLIRPPGEALLRGLTQLEKGEEWLLQPKQDQANPLLWSPGIKLGVQQGSFTHQTELFGPVLGLMRADNLEHAIALANSTPYGLTAGLHTLDAREKEKWLEKIEAGNCYINRTITGAIVLRQPFGGCKASSFGPGAKAGGPNYLMQMMHPVERRFQASLASYQHYWDHLFKKEQIPIPLLGQQNCLCYVPRQAITLRVQAQDSPMEIERLTQAAQICGTPLIIDRQPEEQFILKIREGTISRIRCLSSPSEAVARAAAETGITLIVAPVLANGRLELLHFLREVSLSHETHRYGNLS